MKELYFTADLLTLFRNDPYYGVAKNLSLVLRKVGLSSVEQGNNLEQMYRALAIHIMDQGGESEPFLAEVFIYPEAAARLLKGYALPVPGSLQPVNTMKSTGKKPLDQARIEEYFEIVCRNCGTVVDPHASAYRTPLGRLIFRIYLETRLNLGINTTAKYVLEHLVAFDGEKIVISVNEDSVIWLSEGAKEKITSAQTIAKLIMKFNRELDALL